MFVLKKKTLLLETFFFNIQLHIRLYLHKFPRALTDFKSTYRSYVNTVRKYKGNIVELLSFECNYI